jgi:hypothetical protein
MWVRIRENISLLNSKQMEALILIGDLLTLILATWCMIYSSMMIFDNIDKDIEYPKANYSGNVIFGMIWFLVSAFILGIQIYQLA